ncbi:MAG: methyltransferase domain-containing protein [Candidatus Hadarchaeum sp.]|uniref:class I SAM-dependent methyltransferase n=1 Tax=Candidatus Hadarchaeum sp. TaxID=2883567 RepID=UPI0031796C80
MQNLRENKQSINQWRLYASQKSGGTSSDVIYTLIARIIEKCSLSGRVLDFGAGKGLFTQWLHRCGRFNKVCAADLLPKPPDLPDNIEWWVGDLNHPTGFSAESFDVIVAAEIIEHLENPREVAREWFRLLCPGGILIMTTPNNESWRAIAALIFKGHFSLFLAESYPAHITALVRKDIERILLEAGFESPQFQFTDKGYCPIFRCSWDKVIGPLAKGIRFSDNLAAISRKPTGVS